MEKDFLNVNTVKNNVCGIKYYLFGGMIMTREEIEKLSAVEPFCIVTDEEERWYEVGCIDGLKAADAEPNLECLWHNASEFPNDQDEYTLCYSEYYDCFFMETPKYLMKKDGGQTNYWETVVLVNKISKWAYVKDLLPKGGKK